MSEALNTRFVHGKKLYQLNRGAKFFVVGWTNDEPITLNRLDGMYSICTYKGETAHIAGYAEVVEVINE